MRIQNMKKILLVGAISLGLSGIAFASGSAEKSPLPVTNANAFNPGMVVGLQAGYGMSGWENFSVGPLNTNSNNALTGRVYLGWDFYPNFGIELGYMRFLGKAKINLPNITFVDEKWGDYSFSATDAISKITTQSIDLIGKAKWALNDMFGIYAKAGVAYLMSSGLQNSKAQYVYVDTDTRDTTSGSFNEFSNNSFNKFTLVYGLGVSYNITSNLVADLSWLQYLGDSSTKCNSIGEFTKYQPSVNFFALGLSYKFM